MGCFFFLFAYSRSCIPQFQNIFITPKRQLYHQQSLPPIPLYLQPLATTNFFVSMDLPTLDILYKNNHIICGILSLALPCFQVSSMLQYFIPTYGQIVFHWIYHLLFTHSSFDGHLGCFHFLPIMNNAEVDLNEQIFV